MPADLDSVLDDLRTEADSIPLTPPYAARQRGTRRTRTRALTTSALAVCLAAGGAWYLAPTHPAPPSPAATTAPKPLPELGTAVPYGGTARAAVSAVGGGSTYTFLQGSDYSVRFFERPLGTAGVPAPVFRAADVQGELDGAVVLGGKLVVGSRDGAGYEVRGVDPASGAVRWDFTVATPADVALFERYVVYRERRTGLITALDADSGRAAWTAPSDPGPVTPLLAVGTSDLAPRAGSGSLPPIQPRITESGDPASYIATVAGDMAVLLRPDTGKRHPVLFPTKPGGTVIGCGEGRLCVADDLEVSVLDSTTGTPAWKQRAPGRVTGLTWAGTTLIAATEAGSAVYDLSRGTPVAVVPGPVVRGARSLFSLPAEAGGPVTRIGGEVIGSLPFAGAGCTATEDRLICPGTDSLRIFVLPRD